jgi:CBS domain-containing protein
VGLLKDHDLYRFSRDLDQSEVGTALSQELITVTPETTIHDAARLLGERKVDALPVVHNGALVGMILAIDLLDALIRANFD